MPGVPGENCMVVDARRRRDGEISRARLLVHQQPADVRRRYVEPHRPVSVEMKNDIEPAMETVGSHEAAGSCQLGDANAGLGHRCG